MKKGNIVAAIISAVVVVGVIVGAFFIFDKQGSQASEPQQVENQNQKKEEKKESQENKQKEEEQAGENNQSNQNGVSADPLAKYPAVKKSFNAAVNLPENAFKPWKLGDRNGESTWTRFNLKNEAILNWLQQNIFVAENEIVAARNGTITKEVLRQKAQPLLDEYKKKLDEFRGLPAEGAGKEYQQNLATVLEAFYQIQLARFESVLNGDPGYGQLYNMQKQIMDKFNALQNYQASK